MLFIINLLTININLYNTNRYQLNNNKSEDYNAVHVPVTGIDNNNINIDYNKTYHIGCQAD